MATPLGNPGDLSPRARDCLNTVDIVLAEDTRRAALAFRRWGIQASRLISVHDHNESHKSAALLEMLREGQSLALISDAGMPVVADPGYILIRHCREAGLPVSVIPGPSAPITALAGSGIPPQPFVFFGFLPRKTAEQEKTLAPYAGLPVTLVFFERKDRLSKTLAVCHALLGAREACMARELTKTHEEYQRFRLENPPDFSQVLGEVTLIIGPPEETLRTPRAEVEALIALEQPHGGTPRDIARRVQAQITGWTTSQIYSMLPRKNTPLSSQTTNTPGALSGSENTPMASSSRIADNRKARQYYEFMDFFEAGLVLTGPEVKSLRAGQVSFGDSFVEFRQGEAYVVGLRIAPYERAGYVKQDPDRPRKLLLHTREIHMLATKVEQKGLTVVPVNLHFKHGKVKMDIALAKGRKLHDQRDELKRRAEQRDMERELVRH